LLLFLLRGIFLFWIGYENLSNHDLHVAKPTLYNIDEEMIDLLHGQLSSFADIHPLSWPSRSFTCHLSLAHEHSLVFGTYAVHRTWLRVYITVLLLSLLSIGQFLYYLSLSCINTVRLIREWVWVGWAQVSHPLRCAEGTRTVVVACRIE
jgi:hypothetical protein